MKTKFIQKTDGKTADTTKYLQYNDKTLNKLEGDQCQNTPRLLQNRHNRHNHHIASDIGNKQALEFILTHFEAMDFPRRISTRTTEGRQITVNDKPEALARFKQANWLDCRISAYTELDDSPNFLFVDIDTLDQSVLRQVLDRCAKFGFHPTVLFTGSGYHVYQPVHSVRLHEVNDFAKFNYGSKEELANRFLRVAENYISSGEKDPNHNPSLKSCMVRVPGSINSKNGQEVRIIQKWDGKRPCIAPLLGIFYSWLASRKIIEEKYQCPISKFRANNSSNKINWIEILLKTPLYDYRKGIVNLVLAPYFVNIRHIDFASSFAIIKRWLERCAVKRKLDFYADPTIDAALQTAQKSGYKPMRLDTLKVRNLALYEMLGLK